MADEGTSADDALAAVMQKVAPTGGVDYRQSNAARRATEAQTDADADAALEAVVRRMTTSTTPTTAADPSREDGILSRSWRSILDLPKTLARDLTPSAPHLPGTSGPQLAPGLAASPVQAPIQEPSTFTGFRRGASDILDSGAEGLAWGANKVLPTGSVDLEGLRAKNKADRDAWEARHSDDGWASVGRVGGQIAASTPILRGVGGLIGRGAPMLPAAIGKLIGTTTAESGLGRIAQLAGQGAATGAAEAGLTAASSDQPLGEQVGTGALTGAVVGPAIGGVTKAIDVLRGYAGGVRPEVARLAQEARKLGQAAGEEVNIPVAKLSENPYLKMVADTWSKLPFSGTQAADLRNQRGLQGVVARQMGSGENVFDAAMMRRTADDISAGYQRAISQVPAITGGAPLATDLAQIGADATRFISDREGVSQVGRAIREVGDAFNNSSRSINADQYRSLVESKGTLQRLIDGTSLPAAKQYIERVRDALEARLRASAPPGVADEFHRLDGQWRAMHTVAPLAAKSNLGDIPLAQLKQQVINQSNKYDGPVSGVAFGGGGPLADVGRIGSQFFGHLPESGTAPRTAALNPFALGALAIPGVLNRPLQWHLRRPTVSQRIIDTSLGGPTPDIGRMITPGLLGPVDIMRDRQ